MQTRKTVGKSKKQLSQRGKKRHEKYHAFQTTGVNVQILSCIYIIFIICDLIILILLLLQVHMNLMKLHDQLYVA